MLTLDEVIFIQAIKDILNDFASGICIKSTDSVGYSVGYVDYMHYFKSLIF